MKSNRQQKRKIGEVIRKQDECVGVSVKKSAHGTGQGHQKATVSESAKISGLEPQVQLQIPSTKIKLQLFPIDDNTRLGLEKDGYNPFLELSLSNRKKMSSVVKHLDSKWGRSIVATGQLMLFPYDTKLEKLASCRRWTLNDSSITTGEVYVAIGRPSLFRLRYCWCSDNQMQIFGTLPTAEFLDTRTHSLAKSVNFSEFLKRTCPQENNCDEAGEGIQKQSDKNGALHLEPTDHVGDRMTADVPLQSTVAWDDLTNLSIGGLLREISLQGKGSDLNSGNRPSWQETNLISDMSFGALLSEASLLQRMGNSTTEPANKSTKPTLLPSSDISIGGLLREISLPGKSKGSDINPGNKPSWPEGDLVSNRSIGGLQSESFLLQRISNSDAEVNKSTSQPIVLPSSDLSVGGLLSEASILSSKSKPYAQPVEGGNAQIVSPWDDGFTSLSIGGFFNESSLQAKAVRTLESEASRLTSNMPFSDSLDAFLASQLKGHSQVPKPTYHREQSLSLLDAEETCHAFSTRKFQPPSIDGRTSDAKA